MEKQKKPDSTGMACKQVWKEISTYLDGALDDETRLRLDSHFATCANCKAVLDGAENVKHLMGDQRAFEIPENVSRRLYAKLEQHLAPSEEITVAGNEIP